MQNLLIKEGLAQVAYLYGDYKYTSALQETQTQTKDAKLGIWKEEVTSNYSEEEMTNRNIIANEIEQESSQVECTEEIGLVLLLLLISIALKYIKKQKRK